MADNEEEPQVEEEEEDEEAFLPVQEGDFYSYGDLLKELGATADEDGIHLSDDLQGCLSEKHEEPGGLDLAAVGEDNLLIIISVSHDDKTYNVRCELSVEAMKEFDDIENYGFYLTIVGEDVLDEDDKGSVLDKAEDTLTAYLESCKQAGGRRRRKTAKKNKKKKSKKSSNKKRTYRKTK